MSGVIAPPPPKRFHRSAQERGPSLAEKLSGEVQRLSYGTLLHRLQLRERFPAKLMVTPRDPVPGDAEAGHALIAGKFAVAGQTAPLAGFDWRVPASPVIHAHADSFDWLADLAAARSPRAEPVARKLTAGFLAANAAYNPIGWAPERIGRRMLNWVFHANLLLGGDDLVHRSAVLTAMTRGCRHLDRAMAAALDGMPRIFAAAGAIAAGLALPGGDDRAARGEALLAAALAEFVGADGAVGSRAPGDQLQLLELLQRLAALYAARSRAVPELQRRALAALGPAVAGMVMGDGCLATFHGAISASPARIAAATAATAQFGPEPEAGYQRFAAGSAVLVFDAGPPPDQHFSRGCHASTFAFELSDGPERLIVSCGGVRMPCGAPAELAAMLRTTAAHSTLVLADTNSTRLREDGCLGRGVTEVTVHREDGPDGQFVEATHDGYSHRYGASHRRRLFLSPDGCDLRGEDEIVPLRRHSLAFGFAVRFHLDPGVAAEATGNDVAMLTPGGAAWRFRSRDLAPVLEDSIVVGADGRIRRTRQIVLSGEGAMHIAWAMRKLA